MLLEEHTKSISESEAARFAAELYGITATAHALPGEYDDNFHLVASDGREFVLKVMHPARERSFIEMQCAALRHLAKRAPHLELPRVCATRSGENFSSVATAAGLQRLVWLQTYVRGTPLAEARPHSHELLRSLGKFLGEMDSALADFSFEVTRPDLKWDFANASAMDKHLPLIRDAARRSLAERFFTLFETEVVPVLASLRHSVIYGDANDHNILVGPPLPLPRKVVSVIDFGDMHYSATVADLAIAAAYAILDKREPLRAATDVVAGYHRAYPLAANEVEVLYTLIGTRLAMSVANSAQRSTVKPSDDYVRISEAPAWEALERWASIHPGLAHYSFRAACELPAVPRSHAIGKWLASKAESATPVLDLDLRSSANLVFDLSVGSPFLRADLTAASAAEFSVKIFDAMKKAGAAVGIGRYNEARLLYSSPLFAGSDDSTGERRTIHLGIDLFVEPGTALRAPLDGIVQGLANNTAALDYGPVVTLRHVTGDGTEFFTLYGHLTKSSLDRLRVGQSIARGENFAQIGAIHENGGWPPHLHFQIIADLLDRGTDFPGVGQASQRAVWTSLSPDPNLLLGIPVEQFPAKEKEATETLHTRRDAMGGNLSVSYRQPLKIVRGWMQYLYDDTGRAYLDVYNNVPLVGHSHPRVVRAVQEQLAVLNTNTRYLHDGVIRYAERLTALLPAPLRVCYFLNSGSEANELALRLARAHTRREDVMVLEHAYHGNTNTLIDISPYKFNGPGGSGQKPWVHVAPLPDDYRGEYRRDDEDAGKKYAEHVKEILRTAKSNGRDIAAFIAETLPSVAGQIVFPRGYLPEAYRHVRAAGGVCIADEVQVGFGRLGTHFWGFETQQVVPDIVVLGKPIGNAFPLAAVVTTPEIGASFANGMEFFSTFGGNPVACAAGLAVLDVVRDEKLQERALRVGSYLLARLNALRERHEVIGDVRGSGLFLGVDLVQNRETRSPATQQADYIVNRLRESGILAGTDGPHHNVIKLRPPLIFSETDADVFLTAFDDILAEDGSQHDALSDALPPRSACAAE